MKKLALALVCLVSVAFFASCTPEITNPEPSIAVKTGEGYISDGAILNVDTEYKLGILAASNTQTMKDLANFRIEVKIFSMEGLEVDSYDSTWLINGSEFEYEETWSFGEAKDLVGTATITATVTDVAGKFNSVKLDLSINQPAQPLIGKTIEWVRRGSNALNAEEMAEYGLQWVARDAYHANIRPLDGVQLYVTLNDADAFNNVETDFDLLAYFANLAETAEPVAEYRNISTAIAGDTEYNDVLATIDAEGNAHIILFEKANVQTGSFGVQTTITGQAK